MINVKEVEYDEWDCTGEDNAVCPYCGHNNEIIPDGEREGEQVETECESCEKTFMYGFEISVRYDTQPVENYYLKEHERILNRIDRYEIDNEPYTWQKELVKRLNQDLVQLDKWIESLI